MAQSYLARTISYQEQWPWLQREFSTSQVSNRFGVWWYEQGCLFKGRKEGTEEMLQGVWVLDRSGAWRGFIGNKFICREMVAVCGCWERVVWNELGSSFEGHSTPSSQRWQQKPVSGQTGKSLPTKEGFWVPALTLGSGTPCLSLRRFWFCIHYRNTQHFYDHLSELAVAVLS